MKIINIVYTIFPVIFLALISCTTIPDPLKFKNSDIPEIQNGPMVFIEAYQGYERGYWQDRSNLKEEDLKDHAATLMIRRLIASHNYFVQSLSSRGSDKTVLKFNYIVSIYNNKQIIPIELCLFSACILPYMTDVPVTVNIVEMRQGKEVRKFGTYNRTIRETLWLPGIWLAFFPRYNNRAVKERVFADVLAEFILDYEKIYGLSNKQISSTRLTKDEI